MGWWIPRSSRAGRSEVRSLEILVGCEESGTVRDEFRALGHNAWSCDLKPTSRPSRFHHQGDVLEVVRSQWWDLFIVHPPCTYLSSSGLHWVHRQPGRLELVEEAVQFATACWEVPDRFIGSICMENPVGYLSRRIRPPDQIIQPYEFGDDASKATCLWLRRLPLLRPTRRYPGRLVQCNGREVERWSNQTDSGQNKLSPSDDRSEIRSVTYPGIATAMACQWSRWLLARLLGTSL